MKNALLWKEANRFSANVFMGISAFLVFISSTVTIFHSFLPELLTLEQIVDYSMIFNFVVILTVFPLTETHLIKFERKNKMN